MPPGIQFLYLLVAFSVHISMPNTPHQFATVEKDNALTTTLLTLSELLKQESNAPATHSTCLGYSITIEDSALPECSEQLLEDISPNPSIPLHFHSSHHLMKVYLIQAREEHDADSGEKPSMKRTLIYLPSQSFEAVQV